MMDPFNDEYFMKQALVEACSAAEEGEVPVGAVIVCNNQIIARAHNQTERLNDPTAHAEMLAITAAVGVLGAKYLTGCSLYVTVEPCVMCAGAIGWSQLSKIVYGATDEKRGFQQYAPKALHRIFLKVRKIENPIRKTSRIKKKNITNKNLNIFRHLVGLLHKHKDTNSCLPSFVKKRQGYIENDCSGNAQNTKESHKDHRPGH